MPAGSATRAVSRSVYVSQLRRAFLLRAHPDRFRNFNESVGRRQARLLQALGERWNEQDFRDYAANQKPISLTGIQYSTLPYVLEKRDGSLLEQKIRLDDSVENVLTQLAKALQLSGTATVALPPPPASQEGPKVQSVFDTGEGPLVSTHRPRGRDIHTFLQGLTTQEMDARMVSRMDASAAALVARRLYSFQAIDGVRMGWSSESFAILLKSLIRLHDEHSHRLAVKSFYPLRLVFSHDDFQSPLDVYGGILYLHPAATQLQLLESLQTVTQDRLDEFVQNRRLFNERTALLQNALGVKLTKGHSASSEEYHSFLERLARRTSLEESTVPTASALELERVRLVIESSAACRRSRVRRDGRIESHTDMDLEDLIATIHTLMPRARDVMAEVTREEERCKEAIKDLQYALGVDKVTRRGPVSLEDFLGSMQRLREEHQQLRDYLSGHAIGIASEGQFCHLADDGSIVIPHDWA